MRACQRRRPVDCHLATAPPPCACRLQFIILTHDDAITAATDANIRAVITNHKNKNGCNMCELGAAGTRAPLLLWRAASLNATLQSAHNMAMFLLLPSHCRPATFFVLKDGTDCELARKFYDENSEVGGEMWA